MKLILIDVDGVVLNFNNSFTKWMAEHGHESLDDTSYDFCTRFNIDEDSIMEKCAAFCGSEHFNQLEPIAGAIYHINKLHSEHGYKFHFITSVSDNEAVVRSRINNLKRYIEHSAIHDITCLGPMARKFNYLHKMYGNSNHWWIEDSVPNYQDGLTVGLRSILVDQPYNQSANVDNRVYNWEEIYAQIVNGEQQIRIGITGTHSSGKTTLLEDLQATGALDGYYISTGVTRALQAKGVNINESGNDVGQLAIMTARLDDLEHDDVLADRTLIDVLAYSEWLLEEDKLETSTFKILCEIVENNVNRYDLIIHIEPEIALADDGVRSTDESYRTRIAQIIRGLVHDIQSIEEQRLNIIRVSGSREERVAQVLKAMGK